MIESRYAANAGISVLLASGRVRKTTDGTKENGGSPEILDVESIFSKEQSVLYEASIAYKRARALTQRERALLIKELSVSILLMLLAIVMKANAFVVNDGFQVNGPSPERIDVFKRLARITYVKLRALVSVS